MLFELTIEFVVRLELLLVRLLLCLLDEDLDVDLGGVESIVGSSLATICWNDDAFCIVDPTAAIGEKWIWFDMALATDAIDSAIDAVEEVNFDDVFICEFEF